MIKIFLIPKGYEGSIVIIEDQKQINTPIKGDTLIFDFRKSKILRLKSKFIEGVYSLSNVQYYYVDSFNNRTIIPTFINGITTNVDSNRAYVYVQKTMIGSECPKIGLEGSQSDLITKPGNVLYNSIQQEELFDSLITCPVDTI